MIRPGLGVTGRLTHMGVAFALVAIVALTTMKSDVLRVGVFVGALVVMVGICMAIYRFGLKHEAEALDGEKISDRHFSELRGAFKNEADAPAPDLDGV